MCGRGEPAIVWRMPQYLLHHRHEPRECPAAFAAWKGFSSPLRRLTTIGSCLSGGHEIWWELAAPDEREALAHLPPYVAARTQAIRISPVRMP
jgi:hypothetical protein